MKLRMFRSKKFPCVFLLLLFGLSIVGNFMPQQRFIPEVHAEPDTPKAKWVFFRDSHVDYGYADEQRWLNQCDWIAGQSDIDLVLNAGDFVTKPRNDTAWDVVAQGIQKFNSTIKFLSAVGNHDAYYNATREGGDYDRYLKATGMTASNYSYIYSNPDLGDIMIVSLALQYTSMTWSIHADQWEWFDNVVNATDLPVVAMLHPAPASKYVLHQSSGTFDSYWDDHFSKHENLFMILFGHCHEPQYYIGKGTNGNPILMLTSYSRGYGGGGNVHHSYLALIYWYENKIEVKNYDPWTDTWYDSSKDGESITIPFYGIQALGSGHLKNDDFTRTGDNETYVRSPPKSFYSQYGSYFKAEIAVHRVTYWVQIWARYGTPFKNNTYIQYAQGVSARTPIKAKWKDGYFYPNATTWINVTLPQAWYNYIYFVNETSETYSAYVYNTAGSLLYNGTFNFIESLSGFDYGYKLLYVMPYAYIDNFAITYDTTITTQSGTTITLSNGTQIAETSFDIRELTGAIMLLNCTVTRGDETRVMDIYGGDEIGTFYSQNMLLKAVADKNNNLKNNSNPYIWNVTRAITALSFSSTGLSAKLSLTVQAGAGEKSITRVYCGDKGEPTNVTGTTSWSYNSETKIATINVLHTSSKEVILDFDHTPPTTPGDIDGDGDVDFDDFIIFALKYGINVGEPGYDPRCDLNFDGDVDHLDFIIFALNYGESM